MRSDLFAKVLSGQGKVLAAAGAGGKARQLEQIASALAAKSPATVDKIAKALQGARVENSADSMVADIMEAVKTLLADLGKAPAAKDMALVCALYRRLGDTLPSAIAQADLGKPSGTSKKVDIERAKTVADKLVENVLDPQKFDKLLAEIEKDRTISKPLLDKISQLFLGHDVVYPSKKKTLEKFRERSNVDILNDQRSKVIDRVRA